MSSSQQKTPKGKGNNTLLNYFSKTQGSSQKVQSSQASRSVLSENNGSPPVPLKSTTEPKTAGKLKSDSAFGNAPSSYKVGDLVMAQVDGYPFWPGVVALQTERGSSQRQFKVLFLGEYSRAWVTSRYAWLHEVVECCVCWQYGNYIVMFIYCESHLSCFSHLHLVGNRGLLVPILRHVTIVTAGLSLPSIS